MIKFLLKSIDFERRGRPGVSNLNIFCILLFFFVVSIFFVFLANFERRGGPGVSGSFGEFWGGSGAAFWAQRRNIRPRVDIDPGAIVMDKWPSAVVGVLLFSGVAIGIFARRAAKCGVPIGLFCALFPAKDP